MSKSDARRVISVNANIKVLKYLVLQLFVDNNNNDDNDTNNNNNNYYYYYYYYNRHPFITEYGGYLASWITPGNVGSL